MTLWRFSTRKSNINPENSYIVNSDFLISTDSCLKFKMFFSNHEINILSHSKRKCVFWHMRTAKAQISLRIRTFWSGTHSRNLIWVVPVRWQNYWILENVVRESKGPHETCSLFREKTVHKLVFKHGVIKNGQSYVSDILRMASHISPIRLVHYAIFFFFFFFFFFLWEVVSLKQNGGNVPSVSGPLQISQLTFLRTNPLLKRDVYIL